MSFETDATLAKATAACLQYGPVVTLSGTIAVSWGLDANEQEEHPSVLTLDHPICVKTGGSTAHHHTDALLEMQSVR
jgi:hypothetical protein